MIAIPSYKRHDNCQTAKYLKKAVIFCHEFEVKDYEKCNDNLVVSIPDELQGKGMGIIRNYILDHSDEEVLMMDDDVSYVGLYDKGILIKLNEQEVYDFIESGFRMCRELGTTLWGVNLQSDKKFYREYSPFSLTSVVLGPFFGVINDHDLRFDEDLGLKEDYDFSIQVANKYRKILRFNKYHYSCGHIKLKGGCASYRTMQKEHDQAIAFQKKWGSSIITIQRKTQGGNLSINPVVFLPIKGI